MFNFVYPVLFSGSVSSIYDVFSFIIRCLAGNDRLRNQTRNRKDNFASEFDSKDWWLVTAFANLCFSSKSTTAFLSWKFYKVEQYSARHRKLICYCTAIAARAWNTLPSTLRRVFPHLQRSGATSKQKCLTLLSIVPDSVSCHACFLL